MSAATTLFTAAVIVGDRRAATTCAIHPCVSCWSIAPISLARIMSPDPGVYAALIYAGHKASCEGDRCWDPGLPVREMSALIESWMGSGVESGTAPFCRVQRGRGGDLVVEELPREVVCRIIQQTGAEPLFHPSTTYGARTGSDCNF